MNFDEEDPLPKGNNLPKQQDFDQALAMAAESMPFYWRRVYLNLIKAGFMETQAMDILKAHVAQGK